MLYLDLLRHGETELGGGLRGSLDDALTEQGWEVPESQANFVWLPLGDQTMDFAAFAGENGLVVRPFAGEGACVTIGEDEANARLIDLCRQWRERTA